MNHSLTAARKSAHSRVRLTHGPSVGVRLLAGGVVAWAVVETVRTGGVVRLDLAIAFAGLVAVGELLRITYPTGRLQAPLALAGGLAYALLCSLEIDFVGGAAAQVVTVTALAMVVGAAPHALAGRHIAADGIAQRVLVVAAVAVIHCHGPSAQLLEGRRGELWLQALVMFGALLVAFPLDRALMAVLMLGRGGTSVVRQFVNECQVAPGIALSVGVTAVELAIASQLLNEAWAIPLFSIPLLLTQTSYRRYHGARTTYAQTIEALSKATELAGYTTVGHARRVADLALRIGRSMDLGPQSLNALEQAALLHDLGQMSLAHPIPGGATATLPRQQQLDLAEAGARLIQDAMVPGDISEIVRRHADSAGAETPANPSALASRILAVANAYDDIKHGSGRAATDEEVVGALSSRAGRDFDGSVVHALVSGMISANSSAASHHLTTAAQAADPSGLR